MAGKKQKRQAGGAATLADALTATRSARRRVLALAARLEATENAILAAMAPKPVARPAAPTAPASPVVKRPVGRPRKTAQAAAPAAPRSAGRAAAAGTTPTPARRPVGRPRKA